MAKVNISVAKVNISKAQVNISVSKVNVPMTKVNVSKPKVHISVAKVHISKAKANIIICSSGKVKFYKKIFPKKIFFTEKNLLVKKNNYVSNPKKLII